MLNWLDSLPLGSPSALNLCRVRRKLRAGCAYFILCDPGRSGASRWVADPESAIRARFVPDSFRLLPEALIRRAFPAVRVAIWSSCRGPRFSQELSSRHCESPRADSSALRSGPVRVVTRGRVFAATPVAFRDVRNAFPLLCPVVEDVQTIVRAAALGGHGSRFAVGTLAGAGTIAVRHVYRRHGSAQS